MTRELASQIDDNFSFVTISTYILHPLIIKVIDLCILDLTKACDSVPILDPSHYNNAGVDDFLNEMNRLVATRKKIFF